MLRLTLILLLHSTTGDVDVFVGTKGTGHTFPGATTPFGLIQLSPDNGIHGWPYCSGYQKGRPIVRVSHIHLSGTGSGDGLDIAYEFEPFTPEVEIGYPGFYHARSGNKYLNLTTDGKCGFIRYGGLRLALDLTSAYNWDSTTDIRINPNGTGYRKSSGWSDNTIYFNHKMSGSEITTCISHTSYPPMSDSDFDTALEAARVYWKRHLKVISGIPILETALYHASIHPSEFKNEHSFTIFSTWDTYRSWNTLMTLLYPERVEDWTSSMLSHEYIPVWEIWGKDTLVMSGTHGLSLIGEYVLKGLIDPRKVWNKMMHTLTRKDRHYEEYYSLGYVPKEASRVSASMTLEHAYTDSVMKAIQDKYDLKSDVKFNPRAYKNLFSGDMFYPKSWKSLEFDKRGSYEVNRGFEEGSASTYQFSAFHDFEGMIGLHQTLEAGVCSDIYPCSSRVDGTFKKRLDAWFSTPGICGQMQDLTACIGQYTQSNEPTHHAPYLYTVIGYPELACKYVRQASDFYTTQPDGIPGNEDAGQMSSWLIFAAMGMYPVNPGSGVYILGCPVYPEPLLIKNIKISRSGAGYKPTYYWNEVELDRLYLTHDELLKGGHFHVELSRREEDGHRPTTALRMS